MPSSSAFGSFYAISGESKLRGQNAASVEVEIKQVAERQGQRGWSDFNVPFRNTSCWYGSLNRAVIKIQALKHRRVTQ
jgi:hypothetical protein